MILGLFREEIGFEKIEGYEGILCSLCPNFVIIKKLTPCIIMWS